jgi:ABC-type multidrug transport system ATPase subunit
MSHTTFAIEVNELRKSYGDTEVLKGINLTVKPGRVFALLGPNGAGKSTTIGIICSLEALGRRAGDRAEVASASAA